LTPPPSSSQQPTRALPSKEATAILNRLIDDARTLPTLAWDSPKRTQWRDTARSGLERCGLGDSLLKSFDSAQAMSVGSRTTDEHLRKQMNAGLESMVAVLHSAVEQLGWAPAVPGDHPPKSAHAGFVDTLIIIFVSAAIVIFLLWAASRATGLEAFERLPSWLQDSYKAIWSSIAAGTAGVGLAVFKVLTRKENDPRPNYLLLIGITTGCLLVAIFLLLQMFKAEAKREVPSQPVTSDLVPPKPKWHNEDPSGNAYFDSFNMDPNCSGHPERMTAKHRCGFDRTQIHEPGDGTPYDTWHLYIDAPGPISDIVCEHTGSNEIKERGIKEGNTAECTGEINGGDAEIRFNVKYQQLW
jgi:hypothetical protein